MAGISRQHSSERKVAPCRVEAFLPIDSRGQIVIPTGVRKGATIQDGNKPAFVGLMNRDEVCCLALIHTDTQYSEVCGVVHSLLAGKA